MLMAEIDERIDEVMAFKPTLPRVPVIPELAAVKLRDDVDGFAAGTKGTVVSVYAKGAAYEVEIHSPRHGLVTVRRGGLITA